MFTLNQLEVFIEVVRSGSFSAAGRKLGKAQSAISTAISNLEIEMGVELFDRSSKSPILTQAGNILLEASESLLRQSQSLADLAHTLEHGAESQIGLALDDATPFEMVRFALESISQTYPLLRVDLLRPVVHSVPELVEHGNAALGLTLATSSYKPSINFRRIGDINLANVAPKNHPLSQFKVITFSQLHSYRRLTYTLHNKKLPTGEYLQAPQMWYVSGFDLMLKLLKSGLGWAVMPKHLIQKELNDGTLVELELESYPVTEWQVGLDLIWSTSSGLGVAGTWLRDLLCNTQFPQLVNTHREKAHDIKS